MEIQWTQKAQDDLERIYRFAISLEVKVSPRFKRSLSVGNSQLNGRSKKLSDDALRKREFGIIGAE